MKVLTGGFNDKYLNLLVIALPLVVCGCSISKSSESVSDSASSIVSSPSSISDKETKYEREVTDYTMAHVKSSQEDLDYLGFSKGLSDIAAEIGIVNWDQNSKTYIAIGKGLKKAGVAGTAYESYKKNFAGSDQEKMQNIQKGYDAD
ncbi:MAG: putative lipoprotein [Gammaproteobacteria bacterium]